MAQKKFISLEKLGLFKEEFQKVVEQKDTNVLSQAKGYADSLADNYDSAGSSATAESNAKKYTDAEIAKLSTNVEKAQAQADKGVADAATADGKAVKAQSDVDALKAYVGIIPEGYSEEDVIAFINKKAEETLEKAQGGSSETAASVKAALDAYKTENDAKVTANKETAENAQKAAEGAQKTADEAKSHSEGVASDLASAKSDLEAADTAQKNRITTLEQRIEGLNGAMHFKGVEDSIPEDVSTYAEGDVVIVGEKEYVFDGTAFKEFGDVSAEAKRIGALEGKMTTAESDIAQAKTDIASNTSAINTKANQSDLDAKVETLTNADTALGERIKTVEDAVGESGSIANDIEKAKTEAIETASADATAKADKTLADAKAHTNTEVGKDRARLDSLEAEIVKKASDEDLTNLTTRVTTAEQNITTLRSDVDEAKEKISANEGNITSLKTTVGTKASQDDLDAAISRIAANETAISNFIEASEEEIKNLFV